jgi:hypothetical protein
VSNGGQGLISGVASSLKDIFKGGRKNIRDATGKPKPLMPDYPQSGTKQERIKWLVEKSYYESAYEKLQFHRKWFRNQLIFMCMDGDTPIRLLDNQTVTMRQLAQDAKPVWTYGFDTQSGRIVPVQMEKIWKTGERECVEVALDDGSSFTCTADHKILTWWKGYVEAGKLVADDRLVPLRRMKETYQYNAIFQPLDVQYELEHRLVAKEIYGEIPPKYHVHHKNDIKKDNRPENLEVLAPSVHMAKISKEGRKKISEAKKKFWAKDGNRDKQSERVKQGYKQGSAFSMASKAARSTPEFKRHQSARMKEWWQERRDKLNAENSLSNHRVVSVRSVGIREVFDASVPRTRNFALACGIFVHNCYHDLNVVSDVDWTALIQNAAEYAFPSNYYRSYIKYGAALYVQTAPEFIAQPSSPDPESQAVAEAARAALEIIKENVGYDAIRAVEAFNLRIFGNSFRYSYYSTDSRYGFVSVPVYEDVEVQLNQGMWMCPICQQIGEGENHVCPKCGPQESPEQQPMNIPPEKAMAPQVKGKTEFPRGQEASEVVWPFEIYVRSSAKNLTCAPWLGRVRMVDKVALQATYPKASFGDASGLMPTDTAEATEDIGLMYQQALPDLPSDPTQYAAWYERAVTPGKMVLKQWWFRPASYAFDKELAEDFPDGMLAVKAGDTLLESKNESLDDHWTHFTHTPVPGRFWGDGDDDLIPEQMKLDEVDRLILRHIDFNSLPLMLIDSQRLAKDLVINDAAVMVELKNLGGKPVDQAAKWFPGGQLSTDVWKHRETIKENMQFHSGVSPASIGMHEPGVNTFGGQQQAVSQNQMTLGPLQLIYKEANETWAMQMLKIASENWLDERVQANMGSDGQWQFKKLRGEMLKMGAVKIKARIIPLDPTKQQSFNQAIAVGAFNPQLPGVVRKKALELYQLPEDLDESAPQQKSQMKEIESMKQTGQQIPPQMIRDNDSVHLATLQKYMNSDEWDTLQPQQKDVIYEHALLHINNAANMMATQNAMQTHANERGGPQDPNQQQPEGGGQNPNQNPQFRHDRGVKGQAAKPHASQPSGGNQHHTGKPGMSHSAQQRRRNP